MTKTKSVLTIAISGFLSIAISTIAVNYGATELAALIYVFVPAIVGLATIVLFLLVDLLIKESRTLSTIIFIVINILTGLFMRIDFYYNIINW
jgi:hypothetical protein